MESSSQCDTSSDIYSCNQITIHGYMIQSPSVIPACFMALVVGLWVSKLVKKQKLQSHYFYATAFKLTGIMMTCAALSDCLLISIQKKIPHIVFALFITDVGLTGTIAICYFFCGLNDIGIIKDSQKLPKILFSVIAACYIFTWYYELKYHSKQDLFKYLYDDVVMTGCGGWVIMQILLHINVKNCKGVKYFLLAFLFGGFGFLCTEDFKVTQYLCEKLSCYFSGQFFWFLVTPLCQYLIYKYYIKTRQHGNKQEILPSTEENQQLTLKTPNKPQTLLVNQELPIFYNQPEQMICFQQVQKPIQFIPVVQYQPNNVPQQQLQQKNNFSAHGQYFQFR